MFKNCDNLDLSSFKKATVIWVYHTHCTVAESGLHPIADTHKSFVTPVSSYRLAKVTDRRSNFHRDFTEKLDLQFVFSGKFQLVKSLFYSYHCLN